MLIQLQKWIHDKVVLVQAGDKGENDTDAALEASIYVTVLLSLSSRRSFPVRDKVSGTVRKVCINFAKRVDRA